MTVLRVEGVSKQYGSGHTAVEAVKDVTLAVAPGEIVVVMGPSGSGKTTLLSMIGTLARPTTGAVFLGGQDVTRMSERELSKVRLKRIGFIFQSFNLLASLTAEQNVMVPLLAGGMSAAKARRKAREILEELKLGHRLNNLPKDLSGGEKQRVAIARALVNEPELLLADEPTANLDRKTGHEVVKLLCETACREGRAIVIVSHDARIEDAAMRILTIEDGKLIKEVKGGHDKTCETHRPKSRKTNR